MRDRSEAGLEKKLDTRKHVVQEDASDVRRMGTVVRPNKDYDEREYEDPFTESHYEGNF